MKVILVMLATINGKITRGEDVNLSWGGKADKQHFAKLTKEIGTVIMGSSNFEALGRRGLKDRRNIVMTRSPERYADVTGPNLEFSSESPKELVERLAQSGLKEVALIGGGTLNTSFLRDNLISEIYLTIAPKIFTQGIDIFAGTDRQLIAELELVAIEKLDDNTFYARYKFIK